MIFSFDAHISQLSVHQVGNKTQDDILIVSREPVQLNDTKLKDLMLQYFLPPFEKVNEIYRFFHPNGDLKLNETFHFVSGIFNSPADFHENSRQLAKHLHEVSTHPNIKSGEMYVCYFSDVQIEGELVDAVGIFKSETKDTYFKAVPNNGNYSITYEDCAVNMQKLEKGCLIFNTESEKGFKVAVIDQSSTAYWKEEFLQLQIRDDNFSKTHSFLGIYKNFVTERLDEQFDISKADKIDLLNRSIKYFKEKENFDLEEFGQEVIGSTDGFQAFKNYKSNVESERETEISESFEISNVAVKKQARIFKSVLKLDKNFHIYIHGNKELIEKGYDDEKNMNFYKVYFKEEI